MADLLPTDVLLVNRAGVDHSIVHSDVMADVLDTDLLLVNRAGVDYQASYADVKKGFGPQHINPAPSDWTFAPGIVSGTGTQADPFIITPETVKAPGGTVQSAQTLTLTGQKPNDLVQWTDHSTGTGNRFHQDLGLVPAGGQVDLKLKYLDTPNSTVGAAFTGDLQIGTSYFRWVVTQQVKVAPVIGSVVLTDSPEAGRFTSGTFASAVTMTEDGLPVSTKGLKAWVEGSLKSAAQTSAITLITDLPGDYCTLDPLVDRYNIGTSGTKTFADGNLKITATAGDATRARYLFGTIGVSSGKWYYEVRVDDIGGALAVGFAPIKLANEDTTQQIYYISDGRVVIDGTTHSSLPTYTTGDVIGIALDLNGNTVQFYKKNTAIGSTYSITGGIEYLPFITLPVTGIGSTTATLNFGQRPFAHPVPSGFTGLTKAAKVLTFADNTGLASFAPNDAVTEVGNGDNGTGTVKSVDAAGNTLTLSGLPAGWDVGSAVKGPLKTNIVTVTPKTSAITSYQATTITPPAVASESRFLASGAITPGYDTLTPNAGFWAKGTARAGGSLSLGTDWGGGSPGWAAMFMVKFNTPTIVTAGRNTGLVEMSLIYSDDGDTWFLADYKPAPGYTDPATCLRGASPHSYWAIYRPISVPNVFRDLMDGVYSFGSLSSITHTLTLTDTTDLANFSVGDVVQTKGTGNAAWNETQVWSASGTFTASAGWDPVRSTPSRAFDGDLSVRLQSAEIGSGVTESTLTWEPKPPIPATTARFNGLLQDTAFGTWTCSINDGAYTLANSAGTGYIWHDISSQITGGEIRKFQLKAVHKSGNSAGAVLGAFEVNGKILVDAAVVKVTAITPATPSITVDGGSWSGTDGTSSGTLADREAFVTGPTKTLPAANVKLYCKLDAAGAVSDLQSADPGYVIMAGNSPYTLTWPATMPTGNAPDVDLPAGTTLTTEIQATSTGSTAVTKTSNIITPA